MMTTDDGDVIDDGSGDEGDDNYSYHLCMLTVNCIHGTLVNLLNLILTM